MNEGMMIRVAIAAVVWVGGAGCFPDPRNRACTGPDCTSSMPLPCSNGIKDGQETDVDCGGPTCRRCPGTRSCVTSSDCFSGNCVAGTNTCYALPTVTFSEAVTYDSGYKTYVMLAADLDGDGDIDLAAENEQGSAVAVFRNTGSGLFERLPAPTQDGFPTGAYPTGGAIADFNRDGISDVITADYHGNSVSILLGAGAGDTYTLTQASSYPTIAGAETSNLAVGDLTGDGILDVIATNPQAHSMSVFIGRADGTLGPATDVILSNASYDLSEPYSAAIGDFNNDGINDAAIADNRSGTVYVELGNGDGTFAPGPSQPSIDGVQSFILIARDMDLDGNLDLIVANRSSDDVSVLLGRGDGGFAAAVVSSIAPSMGPYSVAVADFNLDGVPDVVTANFMSSNATVLLGIGDGGFDAPIDAGMTGTTSYGVAAGDFNGDGKPDFAIANAVSNNVSVKMNMAH